jgi:hypothetical protein
MGQVAVFLADGVPQASEFFSRRLPAGLTSCGTTDFSTGPSGRRWLKPPFPEGFGGAFMEVWAQRVSCPTARRLASARRGPAARGYRCVVTKQAHEFRAVRCTRGNRTIRWETGA